MNNHPCITINNYIAYITLNALPQNKMDSTFFNILNEQINCLFKNKQLRGVIISGAGRHFSSGANLKELVSLKCDIDIFKEQLKKNSDAVSLLTIFSVPVVAAISGCCLGAGLELALAAHYRIATENAIFSLPESTYGIIPGLGGTIRLPRLIGKDKALEIVLTGRIISAQEALSIGVVNMVTKRHLLISKAIEYIDNKKWRQK